MSLESNQMTLVPSQRKTNGMGRPIESNTKKNFYVVLFSETVLDSKLVLYDLFRSK